MSAPALTFSGEAIPGARVNKTLAVVILWRDVVTRLVVLIVLASMLNLFVFLAVPHYGSPRLFVPM